MEFPRKIFYLVYWERIQIDGWGPPLAPRAAIVAVWSQTPKMAFSRRFQQTSPGHKLVVSHFELSQSMWSTISKDTTNFGPGFGFYRRIVIPPYWIVLWGGTGGLGTSRLFTSN